MDYIGEHLLPGKIGHLLIILSFVASIVATISYFIAARTTSPVDETSWKRVGRVAFFLFCVCVVGVFFIIY
jgi:cytochrome c-type biogenesis protein CcmF